MLIYYFIFVGIFIFVYNMLFWNRYLPLHVSYCFIISHMLFLTALRILELNFRARFYDVTY